MKTLVLNRHWMPVGQITWKKGFSLIFRNRAEPLEYYEHTVKTPSTEFFIPAVVRLFHYSKVPQCVIRYSRKAVLERDMYRCQYCLNQLSNASATIDHVLPRAMGGPSNFENTVASCKKCNIRKGAKLLKDTKMSLMLKPMTPREPVFRLKIGPIEEEWEPYLPKGILNARRK